MPDVVPNTLLEEESSARPITEFTQASKPPRRLTRRVASQPPADPEPSVPQKSTELEPESEPETLQLRPRRVRVPRFSVQSIKTNSVYRL